MRGSERTRSSVPAGVKFFDTETCYVIHRNVMCLGKGDADDGEASDIAEFPMNSVKRGQKGLWWLILYCLGASALSAALVHFLLRW